MNYSSSKGLVPGMWPIKIVVEWSDLARRVLKFCW